MAQITVTGILKDFDGDFPTSGTVTFAQSGMFIDPSGAIIPATSETANVSSVDGSFSMTLSSTLDGIPSNVSYAVSFTGVIEGAPVTQSLGSIQLAASPSSVLLKDLIIAGIGGGTAVTPTISAADVSLSLRESDQTLPAGLWRIRVNGDILTLEKNTAVAGDFSTLTEVLRSTATLFTLDIDQRISSAAPRLQWYETDQAADEKLWDVIAASKVLTFRTRTDADGAGVTWMSVTRGTGTAVTSVSIPGLTFASPLTVPSGGTGVATLAANGVLYGNAAGVVLVTAQGGANSVLTANAGAPSFTSTPTVDTITANKVAVVSGGSLADATLTLRASEGFCLQTKAGSSSDFTMLRPASAANIISVPTGTATVKFWGGVGFFSTDPPSQQVSGANLTNNVTSGGTNDTIANYTDLTTYANDAAAIRNDIYQLSRKLKQINDGLRAYGLFT